MHLPVFALTMLLMQTWFSTPFLDQFVRRETAPAVEQTVHLQVGRRQVAGCLVTPAGARCPAAATDRPGSDRSVVWSG